MKRLWIAPVLLAALFAGGAARIVQDQCGPFTDVTPAFCPFVSELYYLGITVGTSSTTFSPDDPLTRGQAAVFVAKGLNQSLTRSSRRAALGQWWTTTPHYDLGLGVTLVGSQPFGVASDGADVWVANQGDGTVSRVRESDGKLLETWTGASGASHVLAAMGRIFVTGNLSPGALYMIDPSQPPGAVTTVASDLGDNAYGLAFDGSRIWTANLQASVSILTPSQSLPWVSTTVTTGFLDPTGFVWDGSNIWVTEFFGHSLLKLDSNGAIVQTVPLGPADEPAFDGANIWVPGGSGGLAVVRASTGAILATFSGNGLNIPVAAAFDGERILVTSEDAVSLWRASDLTPLGSMTTPPGSRPLGACSDGINFWVSLRGSGQLARF